MREAYFDSGWVLDQDGSLLGIRLGYDHCAEHRTFPESIADRIGAQPARAAATFVHFERFKQKSFDPQIKPFPVAILVVAELPADELRFVKQIKAITKVVDPGQGNPPRSMLMTAWGSDGLGIQVRGEEGISRLETLHHHLLDRDVTIVGTDLHAVFGRSGLSLAIASAVQVVDSVKQPEGQPS